MSIQADHENHGPWWLDAGTAQCEFCNTAHHEEAAYDCALCDRPVCAACVVVASQPRAALCPECNRNTQGGDA